jgi:hypothetical protein
MKKLSPEHKAEFLTTLKGRFEENTALHKGLKRSDIEKRLDDKALATLAEMEATGGEPDVVKLGKISASSIARPIRPNTAAACATTLPRGNLVRNVLIQFALAIGS